MSFEDLETEDKSSQLEPTKHVAVAKHIDIHNIQETTSSEMIALNQITTSEQTDFSNNDKK